MTSTEHLWLAIAMVFSFIAGTAGLYIAILLTLNTVSS